MGRLNRYAKRMEKEIRSASFWRDVVADGIATFFLMSIQCALPLQWQRVVGPAHDVSFAVITGLGMGFVILVLAEVFGELGGAVMNPAVSVALVLGGKHTILRGFLYICIQCAGAIGGAAFVHGITPARFRDSLAATTLGEDVEPWQGYFVELWLTCLLVFAVYGATNNRRKKIFMPSIPIGLTVALDIFAGFSYTGASMNPARSLGPAVVMDIWDDHWVYWAGPISGGIVATIIYRFMLDRVERPPKPNSDKGDDHFDEIVPNGRLPEKYKHEVYRISKNENVDNQVTVM